MMYTVQRYPVHLIDVVQLANGSRVAVRPVLPQDIQLQRAFVRSLSDEARYSRFMTRLNELPEVMAERFISINCRNRVANQTATPRACNPYLNRRDKIR